MTWPPCWRPRIAEVRRNRGALPPHPPRTAAIVDIARGLSADRGAMNGSVSHTIDINRLIVGIFCTTLATRRLPAPRRRP